MSKLEIKSKFVRFGIYFDNKLKNIDFLRK